MNKDELFDIDIKNKIKNDIVYVPDDINKVFDEALSKCKSKRKFNYKKVAGICAVVLAGTIALSMTMATYATDIPVLRNIFDTFNFKKYENYDKYASDINITKEDKGIKVTINKVLYDGIDLQVLYSIETPEPIDIATCFIDEKTKINGKEVFYGSVGNGTIEDECVFVGLTTYNINSKSLLPKEVQDINTSYADVPEEFILTFEIDRIRYKDEGKPIRGKWEFNIPVNNDSTKSEVEEKSLNIDLGNVLNDLKVEKIITSPINTAIQTSTTYLGNKILNFTILDEDGKQLEFKEGSSVRHEYEKGKEATYSTYKYQEIPEGTDSLIVIPYVVMYPNSDELYADKKDYDITQAEPPTKHEIKLNINGSTMLYTNEGSYYGEITKVEVLEDKTNIYYKPATGDYHIFEQIYNSEITYDAAYPVDDYYQNEVPTTKYLPEKGEYLIQFTKPLLKENYTLVYYDYSRQKLCYFDEAFKVDIKNNDR